MKKYLLLTVVLTSAIIFSACTYIPANTSTPTENNSSPINLETPIPTVIIETQDPADQSLVDELNQYQDSSLDKDFADLESQL